MADLRLRDTDSDHIADQFRLARPSSAEAYREWLKDTADLYETTQTDIRACVAKHQLSYEKISVENVERKKVNEADSKKLVSRVFWGIGAALLLIVGSCAYSLITTPAVPRTGIEIGAEKLCETVRCE